jgi:hypothetical protein
MQNKAINHTQYAAAPPQSILPLPLKPQYGNNTISLKLYRTCEACPLQVFLDCLFDNDFSGLIVRGEASPQQMQQAWQELYQEYCEISDSQGLQQSVTAIKELNIGLSKIMFLDAALKVLELAVAPDVVAMLNENGIKTNITGTETRPELLKKIELAKTRAKKWVIEVEQAKKNVEALAKTNETNRASRSYYHDVLMLISKDSGFYVRPQDISVAQFVRESNRLHKKTLRNGNRKNK